MLLALEAVAVEAPANIVVVHRDAMEVAAGGIAGDRLKRRFGAQDLGCPVELGIEPAERAEQGCAD